MISAAVLRKVRQEGKDWNLAETLKAKLAQLRKVRDPFFLTLHELETILEYKLRRQYARSRRVRLPLTDELVTVVTEAAFKIQSPVQTVRLRVRIGLLVALPGVGVPVASAVLALVEPEEYGIIDVIAWEQLFGTTKNKFSDTDYVRYMLRVWELAEELDWIPQRVEWCIWQLTETG